MFCKFRDSLNKLGGWYSNLQVIFLFAIDLRIVLEIPLGSQT